MAAIDGAQTGVTASITGSAGAYSLSLTNASGPTTIQLNDLQNRSNLITGTNQGIQRNIFTLSGIPDPITESSNTITDVIPGVSFTLLNTLPAGSVTLSLATDPFSAEQRAASFRYRLQHIGCHGAGATGTKCGAAPGQPDH